MNHLSNLLNILTVEKNLKREPIPEVSKLNCLVNENLKIESALKFALNDRAQKAEIYQRAKKKKDRKIALDDWQAAVQEVFRLEEKLRR